MHDEVIKKIENIFRNSSSSDELFDAFDEAIKYKIEDFEIYKVLLGNPTLSLDEIKMYTEKLLRELKQNHFQISLWTAKLFENFHDDYDSLESAISYYLKAIQYNPSSHEPFLGLLKLYNFDIDLPSNRRILQIVENGIPAIKYKSKIYFALADLYKRIGDIRNEAKYVALGEKAAENEDNF